MAQLCECGQLLQRSSCAAGAQQQHVQAAPLLPRAQLHDAAGGGSSKHAAVVGKYSGVL
jgi:hypothetical protein